MTYLSFTVQVNVLDVFCRNDRVLADECVENAIEECDKYDVEVPLSEEFDTQAFDQYCR